MQKTDLTKYIFTMKATLSNLHVTSQLYKKRIEIPYGQKNDKNYLTNISISCRNKEKVRR